MATLCSIRHHELTAYAPQASKSTNPRTMVVESENQERSIAGQAHVPANIHFLKSPNYQSFRLYLLMQKCYDFI
jgi:hypothetical protein